MIGLIVLLGVFIFMINRFYSAWFGDLSQKMYDKMHGWPTYMTWAMPKKWYTFQIYFKIMTLISLLASIGAIIGLIFVLW